MKKQRGTLTTCSRGHKFYKSSDCPVCPICWSGYYRKRNISDFPEKLGAPALRALVNNKIRMLAQLQQYTEQEISELHGMGPKTIAQLKQAMKKKKVRFAKQ